VLVKLLFVFSLILPFASWGTIFKVVETSEQIKAADGIIIGRYLSSKTIRLENGSLATQMFFKMDKEYGLRSDFFGMDEVIIHYPGGKLDGERTIVNGVPEFVSGEKVALYTKSIKNRYWGMNLAFGAYKVINYGKEVMLVNIQFPQDHRVGQIKLSEFEKMVRVIKGSGFKLVQSTQYIENPGAFRARRPASVSEGKNRAIASGNEEIENTNEPRSLSTIWLIGFLAFCGGVFRLSRQKKV
jgi:hypothetical protein